MAQVRVTSAVLQGTVFKLDGEYFTIGREPDNTLRLTHTSISKHHAMLTVDKDDFKLWDLHSTNGLIVNGEKTVLRHLKDGDRILLGEIELLFELNGATAKATAPIPVNKRETQPLTAAPPVPAPKPIIATQVPPPATPPEPPRVAEPVKPIAVTAPPPPPATPPEPPRVAEPVKPIAVTAPPPPPQVQPQPPATPPEPPRVTVPTTPIAVVPPSPPPARPAPLPAQPPRPESVLVTVPAAPVAVAPPPAPPKPMLQSELPKPPPEVPIITGAPVTTPVLEKVATKKPSTGLVFRLLGRWQKQPKPAPAPPTREEIRADLEKTLSKIGMEIPNPAVPAKLPIYSPPRRLPCTAEAELPVVNEKVVEPVPAVAPIPTPAPPATAVRPKPGLRLVIFAIILVLGLLLLGIGYSTGIPSLKFLGFVGAITGFMAVVFTLRFGSIIAPPRQ